MVNLVQAAKLAGVGAGAGWATGYALGGNNGKVPMVVNGKIKRGNKKSLSVQRAGAISGLALGAGIGLLKKKV